MKYVCKYLDTDHRGDTYHPPDQEFESKDDDSAIKYINDFISRIQRDAIQKVESLGMGSYMADRYSFIRIFEQSGRFVKLLD